MEVMEWVLRRTPDPQDDVDLRGSGQYRDVTFTLPDGPDDATAPGSPATESLDLEPVFTVIDYTDAQGQHSRRRITLLRILRHGAHVRIHARCHERKAVRDFRLDRIGGFIEGDGEIVTPEAFVRDILGIDLSQPLAPPGPEKRPMPVAADRSLRLVLRPALVMLSAAARADHFLHPEEVDRIMRYTEEAALMLARSHGVAMPGIEEFDRLGGVIRRTRPTRGELVAAVDELRHWPARMLEGLGRALIGVVNADGIVVAEEFDFVAAMRRALPMVRR